MPALDALGLVAKKTALHLPTHHRARESTLEGIGTEGGAHFLLGALEGVVDVEQARIGFQLGLDLAGDFTKYRSGFERGVQRWHGELDGNGVTRATYHRARGHFLCTFDEADVFAPFTGKITRFEIQIAGIMKMNAIFWRHDLYLHFAEMSYATLCAPAHAGYILAANGTNDVADEATLRHLSGFRIVKCAGVFGF